MNNRGVIFLCEMLQNSYRNIKNMLQIQQELEKSQLKHF